MAQTGKCTNRVGCTLAYTGQEIRFEGSPVCPECGQPLTEITKPKKSNRLWLLILALIVLLAIAGGGFYAVERYVVAADASKATPTPAASVAQNQSESKMVEGKSQLPADLQNKANSPSPTPQPASTSPTPKPASSATSPTPTASPEMQQSPPGQKESPAPSNPNKPPQPEASAAEGKSPPGGNASPDNLRHQNPGPQKSPSAGDNSGQQSVDAKPKELSSADVEATKQDVLKRINALPKMSDAEKSKLSAKVETARSMQRVGIVYFPPGSNVLSRPSVDELVALFKRPDLVEKMSDPTLVFIVAGYADLTGDPRGNLKLSDERAQAVSNALAESAGVINLVRTVAMGGTDLLNSKRPDQNRAVEIWAVVP